MAKVISKVARDARSGRFVITTSYVRKQAEEAVRTFVAPVAGAAKAFQKAGKPASEDKVSTKIPA